MKPASDAIISTAVPGLVSWDMGQYAYQNNTCPLTVNPSLWRHAQLTNNWGLFKVTDKVYQIRSFDLSSMTIVEAQNGLIVIDPLLSVDTAKAGL